MKGSTFRLACGHGLGRCVELVRELYIKILDATTHLASFLHGGIDYQSADIMDSVIALDCITDNIFNPIAHQGFSQFSRDPDEEPDISGQDRRVNINVSEPAIYASRARRVN